MPQATAKPAPSTGKVQTKTVTTVVTDPVEQTLPPPISADPEPRDFWPYIETLNANPERWKTHKVTLYRYPLGQAKPQKLGRYVKSYKFENPLVSEDQIFDEFGGSQYDALLKGPGSDGNQTLLAKHSWEMDGPAKNPWATSAPTGAPAPSDTAAILETLLKHLQNLQTARNPAQDPAVKESISLIQQLTSAMPKAQGINELVAGLADLKKLTGDNGGGGNNLRETLGILKELGIIGGEKKSLTAEIKDILEIADTLRGGGATGGGGGKRDWVTSLIDNAPTILEKVTPIADKFADAARNNARVAEIRAGRVPPAELPSATRSTPALVVSATTPAATPAAEPPASRVVAAPETEPATPRITLQPPSLDWVKARAVQLFASGKPGDAVAEWLDSIDEQLGNFLGSMDAAKFSAFVKADPILSQIAAAPRFEEFAAEFVDYFASEGAASSTTPSEK